MRRVVALAAAALLLAGCSQVAALAPVGGDRVTGVRYAANDLLVSNGIDVMTAPVCVMATDKGVTCQGTTLPSCGSRCSMHSITAKSGSVTTKVRAACSVRKWINRWPRCNPLSMAKCP